MGKRPKLLSIIVYLFASPRLLCRWSSDFYCRCKKLKSKVMFSLWINICAVPKKDAKTVLLRYLCAGKPETKERKQKKKNRCQGWNEIENIRLKWILGSFNKQGEFSLTIWQMGSTIYSCTFFQDQERWVISYSRTVSALPSLLTTATGTFSLLESYWTVFSTQAHSGKLMFSQFVNSFWLKHASLYTLHFFYKSHMIWKTSVWFVPFL